METAKRLLTYFLVTTGVIFYLIVGYGIYRSDTTHQIIEFDCSVAEFHPDIPVEVKEACRKIRHVTRV
jgi:hypothetical protein